MCAGLFAAGLLCAVPAPTLPALPSLECKIERSYIGAILDFEFSLVIDGPDKRTWKYHLINRDLTLPAPLTTTVEGAYEVEGNVALFTVFGKDKTPAARFGLNYQRHGKEVFF